MDQKLLKAFNFMRRTIYKYQTNLMRKNIKDIMRKMQQSKYMEQKLPKPFNFMRRTRNIKEI